MNFAEYFKQLQIEYLVTKLRFLIYTKNKDKNFFTKVLRNKEIKIKDLSNKNNTINIFSSKAYKDLLLLEILGDQFRGPNFHYSKGFKKEFYNKDLVNYYREGTSIIYWGERDKLPHLGEVLNLNLDTESISIQTKSDLVITRQIFEVKRNDIDFNKF